MIRTTFALAAVLVPASLLAALPTFTNPLAITTPYHPLPRGGVKVFTGRRDRAKSVIVDIYLPTTRTFHVGGTDVATRVLQETEFANGDIAEISQNFFAQDDGGTVFYFGELVD